MTKTKQRPANPHHARDWMKILRLEEPESQTAAPQPREALVLTNAAGLTRKDPPWWLVEQVVCDLEPGHNRYCCLSAPGGDYLQTLRGFDGYHLELRLYSEGANY